MKFSDLTEPKIFKIIALTTASLIILAFVFGVGVFVGAKKAEFSFKWANEYHRNFGGPQDGIFGEFGGIKAGFINSNGSFGQIIKVDQAGVTIKDKDNVEKVILVTEKTSVVFQRNNLKLSDLKVNDKIVVIGEPNDGGQIEAVLIRVLPAAPESLPN